MHGMCMLREPTGRRRKAGRVIGVGGAGVGGESRGGGVLLVGVIYIGFRVST